MGFLGGSVVKNLLVNVGDAGDAVLIPGLGRSLEEENGNTLQYSLPIKFLEQGNLAGPSP